MVEEKGLGGVRVCWGGCLCVSERVCIGGKGVGQTSGGKS